MKAKPGRLKLHTGAFADESTPAQIEKSIQWYARVSKERHHDIAFRSKCARAGENLRAYRAGLIGKPTTP